MKKLEINFVGGRSRAPWAGRVLLAIAVALSLEAALSYQDVRGSLELNNAKIAASRPRTQQAAVKVSAEEAAAARETVERLGMPWDKLFVALESAASDRVALLGVEPDPKAGKVMISGDGKDYLAALSYVLNLSQAQALSHVQLVRHEMKSNDPQGAVSFSVSAAWSKP